MYDKMLFTVLSLCAVVVQAFELDCGVTIYGSEVLIVGGKQARRGEVPWHVGIYRKTSTTYNQICGGSLISKSVIISAAHCFWNGEVEKPGPEEFAAAVGKIYHRWESNTSGDDQKSAVKEIHIPDHYQGSDGNYQEDLAVVVVASPFQYTQYVRPVCIHFDARLEKRQLQPGNYGKVAGWGLTEKGVSSEVLQVVHLPYIDIRTCIMESPFTFLSHITGDKFCAGYKDSNIAVCLGDSGGGLAFPLTEYGKTRYYLRGVVSSAPDTDQLCNTNEFTAFTQLLKHEHFIKEIWEFEQVIITTNATNECNPLPASLTSPRTGQKAWDKCIEYQERLVFPCSNTLNGGNARINRCHQIVNEDSTGGHVVQTNEFPHLVRISKRENVTDFISVCTGTLISEKFALTSGQCVMTFPDALFAVLGVWKERIYGDQLHYKIKQKYVHPDYKSDKIRNDLTLLELEEPVTLSEYLVPACLHTGDNVDFDSAVTVYWENNWYSNRGVPELTKRYLTKSNVKCPDVYMKHYGLDANVQLCYIHSYSPLNPCNLLSIEGGALQVINKKISCMTTIIGVTSGNVACHADLRPQGYTRLAPYLDWIENIVWP